MQLYRYPGLTQSKAKTLLRKAQEKASAKIVGIDGELVSRAVMLRLGGHCCH